MRYKDFNFSWVGWRGERVPVEKRFVFEAYFIVRWILLCAVLALAACAGTETISTEPVATMTPAIPPSTPSSADVRAIESTTTSSTTTGADDYRIGPQDLLELQVFAVDALNRTVRVNSRGFISLPLIGLVQAAGLTSEQLETSLAEKLAEKYLQNPQVSVFIKEYTSQRVTVEGAVKKPGIYPLRGRTSLLQTLAAAEGLTTVADPNGVRVFRTDPKTGNRATLEFDLEKIRAGEARDPTVQNDDIVQVGESQGKSVAKELIEFILPFRVLTY